MTQPRDVPAPASWRVTQQVEQIGRSGGGSFVPGVLVSFAVSTGESGSVFVPQGDYTPAKVAALIASKVSLMRDVGGLTGPVG